MKLKELGRRLRAHTTLLLGVAAMLSAGCSGQSAPARTALDRINVVLAAAPADAAKYVPDRLKNVQAELKNLNAEFGMHDYASVLSGAPAVLAQAQGLTAAVAGRKAELSQALTKEWAHYAATIPPSVAAVRLRLRAMARARRVHSVINVPAARSDLTNVDSLWTQAQTAFRAGDLQHAVTVAHQAEIRTAAAATALRLRLPGLAPQQLS